MVALLNRTIQKQAWLQEARDRNGRSGALAIRESSKKDELTPPPWAPTLDELIAMQHLGDDWDGLAAAAPSPELLECAIGLASLMQKSGMEPPSRVVPSTAGTVLFEWQSSDGAYCEVEIDRPFHAEVMLVAPGEEPQHWELPTTE